MIFFFRSCLSVIFETVLIIMIKLCTLTLVSVTWTHLHCYGSSKRTENYVFLLWMRVGWAFAFPDSPHLPPCVWQSNLYTVACNLHMRLSTVSCYALRSGWLVMEALYSCLDALFCKWFKVSCPYFCGYVYAPICPSLLVSRASLIDRTLTISIV